MSNFFEQAAQLAEQETETVVLEVGGSVGGTVTDVGVYTNEKYGASPRVTMKENETGRLVAIIGIGLVLSGIQHVRHGDLLYIERKDDVVSGSSGNTYKNYTIIASRNGKTYTDVESLAGLNAPATMPKPVTVKPDEEPF